MTIHWIPVLLLGWAMFFIGHAVGRGLKKNNEVTAKVTNPMDEVAERDWLALIEPHIHKFEVGATFGSGVTFNREGAKAMAELMSEMANRLDYARHMNRKRHKERS